MSRKDGIMSLIQKQVSDFTVQAYQNGEFKTVTKDDIMGKWSVALQQLAWRAWQRLPALLV